MATFQGSRAATGTVARADLAENVVVSTFTIPTGFATADIVEMVKIPAGAIILDLVLASNAAVGSTANLSVGDGGAAARFLASTAHTAATATRMSIPAVFGYTYSADDTVDVTAVSIATPTVGTVLTLILRYTMNA
jgi:hypothetical protein